jgi:hypothetical protein
MSIAPSQLGAERRLPLQILRQRDCAHEQIVDELALGGHFKARDPRKVLRARTTRLGRILPHPMLPVGARVVMSDDEWPQSALQRSIAFLDGDCRQECSRDAWWPRVPQEFGPHIAVSYAHFLPPAVDGDAICRVQCQPRITEKIASLAGTTHNLLDLRDLLVKNGCAFCVEHRHFAQTEHANELVVPNLKGRRGKCEQARAGGRQVPFDVPAGGRFRVLQVVNFVDDDEGQRGPVENERRPGQLIELARQL